MFVPREWTRRKKRRRRRGRQVNPVRYVQDAVDVSTSRAMTTMLRNADKWMVKKIVDPVTNKIVDVILPVPKQERKMNETYVFEYPTVKDRSGRLKYARGVVINGKHVGGDWADIPNVGNDAPVITRDRFIAAYLDKKQGRSREDNKNKLLLGVLAVGGIALTALTRKSIAKAVVNMASPREAQNATAFLKEVDRVNGLNKVSPTDKLTHLKAYFDKMSRNFPQNQEHADLIGIVESNFTAKTHTFFRSLPRDLSGFRRVQINVDMSKIGMKPKEMLDPELSDALEYAYIKHIEYPKIQKLREAADKLEKKLKGFTRADRITEGKAAAEAAPSTPEQGNLSKEELLTKQLAVDFKITEKEIKELLDNPNMQKSIKDGLNLGHKEEDIIRDRLQQKIEVDELLKSSRQTNVIQSTVIPQSAPSSGEYPVEVTINKGNKEYKIPVNSEIYAYPSEVPGFDQHITVVGASPSLGIKKDLYYHGGELLNEKKLLEIFNKLENEGVLTDKQVELWDSFMKRVVGKSVKRPKADLSGAGEVHPGYEKGTGQPISSVKEVSEDVVEAGKKAVEKAKAGAETKVPGPKKARGRAKTEATKTSLPPPDVIAQKTAQSIHKHADYLIGNAKPVLVSQKVLQEAITGMGRNVDDANAEIKKLLSSKSEGAKRKIARLKSDVAAYGEAQEKLKGKLTEITDVIKTQGGKQIPKKEKITKELEVLEKQMDELENSKQYTQSPSEEELLSIREDIRKIGHAIEVKIGEIKKVIAEEKETGKIIFSETIKPFWFIDTNTVEPVLRGRQKFQQDKLQVNRYFNITTSLGMR